VTFPSLRVRLLLPVLVAIAPGFALIFYAAHSQRALLEREAAGSVVRAARLAAEQQQRTIDSARGMLVALAQNRAVLSRDPAGCSQIATTLLGRLPHFSNIGAGDPDGDAFCNAVPVVRPVSIRDRRYFQAALLDRTFSVGEYQVSRARKKPSLNFGYPAFDGAGSIQAIVFGGIDLSFIERQLAELRLPDQSWAVITDHAGMVLAGEPAGAFRPGSPIDPELLERMRQPSVDVAELGGGDGVQRLFAFRTITVDSDTAMRIAVGIPTASVYGPVNRIFRRTLLGYTLVGTLALVFASLAGHLLLVRRLKAVISAARRLSRGDYAARTGLRPTGDELGDLIRAFDEMATSLEALARQNRLILDSAGEGVFGIDRQGLITFVNPAASKLLGRGPDDLLGQDAHLLFHHSRPDGSPFPAQACPIMSLLRGGDDALHVVDDVFQRKGDGAFPVEYVATPIRDRGEIVGAVVAFKDVTDRKRLEEELRQAHKMEAVGRLAGGVAHDFNNMLTVVLSAGRFARDALPAGHPARADVDEILGVAGRAVLLTRQLLAFSRRQVIEPLVLDLGDAVLAVEKMLRRLIGEDVQLETVTRPGLCWVRADPGQIEQVILNLAVNARDAMPAGGRITIAVEPAGREEAGAGDALPPGPLVMLSMTDNGVGMDQATLRRIFEPFFTTKDVGKGTGLGLSTVYGVVHQSGGALRVTSAPGRGTTFRIYLPQVAPPPSASVRPESLSTRGTETVLLVEDEAVLRGLALRALTGAGYRVFEADGPGAALACAERQGAALDLLVTDVILPEASGVDLAHDLTRRLPRLRVLYMSGYTGGHLDARRVSGSGHSFLQKPFTPEVLLRKVREVLDEKGAPAPERAAPPA
jgi:PAS domain S-box-containing protein